MTAAVPVQFKPAPELRLPPRLASLIFFLPHRRSYLGFKWFLSKGLWVNPIRAAHRPVPQPPTKFLCGEKGGTPEQIGLLPPGNRECPVSRSTITELLTSRIGKSERTNKQANSRRRYDIKGRRPYFGELEVFLFFPHECLHDCAVSLAVKFSGKTAHGRRTASKSLYSVSRRTAEVKSE